MFEVYLV